MKEMLKEIAFVLYPVADMPKARAFYSQTLGLKETANWQDQWIEYDIGPGTLAITAGMPGIPAGSGGALAALEVTDFDAVARFLEKQNVPWTSPPFDTPVCRGGMIKDPDGNTIMIHQRKTGAT